jgi:hypothetical protein
MNITLENTRHLGVGDTINSTDYIAMQDDEGQYDFIITGGEYHGHIIDGTEEYEFRRLNVQDPVDLLCIEYDIQTDMGRAALVISIENVATLDRKQRDYGSRNISEFGEIGILMRVWDKICRLKNLMGKENPKNESIDDSWLDMANYAIIAILVRRGIWK